MKTPEVQMLFRQIRELALVLERLRYYPELVRVPESMRASLRHNVEQAPLGYRRPRALRGEASEGIIMGLHFVYWARDYVSVETRPDFDAFVTSLDPERVCRGTVRLNDKP